VEEEETRRRKEEGNGNTHIDTARACTTQVLSVK
jgi:hypothetical protein